MGTIETLSCGKTTAPWPRPRPSMLPIIQCSRMWVVSSHQVEKRPTLSLSGCSFGLRRVALAWTPDEHMGLCATHQPFVALFIGLTGAHGGFRNGNPKVALAEEEYARSVAENGTFFRLARLPHVQVCDHRPGSVLSRERNSLLFPNKRDLLTSAEYSLLKPCFPGMEFGQSFSRPRLNKWPSHLK